MSWNTSTAGVNQNEAKNEMKTKTKRGRGENEHETTIDGVETKPSNQIRMLTKKFKKKHRLMQYTD